MFSFWIFVGMFWGCFRVISKYFSWWWSDSFHRPPTPHPRFLMKSNEQIVGFQWNLIVVKTFQWNLLIPGRNPGLLVVTESFAHGPGAWNCQNRFENCQIKKILAPPSPHKIYNDKRVIVELKTSINKNLDDLREEFPIQRIRFSKYSFAIQSLYNYN